jgi:hypothetical protein
MSLQRTPKFLKRLGTWLHRHPTAAYAIIAVIILLISAVVGFVMFYQKPEKIESSKPVAEKKVTPPPAPVKIYSPLTGLEVPNEAATKQAATAIMIENSPDARPQSGLKAAGVVFEAIAEGGITRFLALYQQEKPQLIGPVRSVRLYYVDWLAPFQPSVAHVGGSLFALQEVRNGKYRDIDQFFNSGSYWRATDRYAPHNVYTSFAKLDALNNAKGYKESVVTSFAHKDGAPSKTPNATAIAINISGPLYNSTYAYIPATNTYARSQAGAPHNDREAGQITPTTVIAMKVNMNLILEDGYREQITTTGEGKATIFQDGIATEATWHKANRITQITFTDASGKIIELNRGQTWITAVPNGSGSVSWQ